jgi:hypothetical protein
MTNDQRTEIEFPCPYNVGEKYAFVITGEYGVFEMFGSDDEINGYRGFRRCYGTTGVYDNYKDALEASFIEFGHLKEPHL